MRLLAQAKSQRAASRWFQNCQRGRYGEYSRRRIAEQTAGRSSLALWYSLQQSLAGAQGDSFFTNT